jgi:PAS domain S-box-containing protein
MEKMPTVLPPYILESLLSKIPAFLFSLRSCDLALLWITEGAGPMTGFEPRDLLARPGLLAERLLPADRENLRRLCAGGAEEFPVCTDFSFRCADGKTRGFRAGLLPAPGPPGNPDATTGIAWSTEELRNASQGAHLSKGVLRAADVPLLFADAAGFVRLWSLAAERFFGWNAVELEGRELRSLFLLPPEAMEKLLRRVRDGETIRREDTAGRKDGSAVPCRATFSLAPGSAARPEGVIVTVTGTAESLAVESRLQDAVNRLRIIERVNRIIASEWDIGIVHRRIAEELAGLIEFDRFSLALFEEGEDPVLIRSHARGDAEVGIAVPLRGSAAGWVLLRRTARVDDDIAASEEPFEENTFLLREGMRSRLMIPLFAGERIVGTLNFHSRRKGAFSLSAAAGLGTIPDQLALAIDKHRAYIRLKKSEEKYRLLFEEGPPAAVAGPDGRFLDVNEGCLRLFGYDRESFLRLTPADLVFDPPVIGAPGERPGDGRTREWELRLRRRDGTPFWGLAKVFFVASDLVFGQIIDITDKRELEGQLLHAQKMEAVGTLAGGIAHDFNNIIQAIIGYTFLLKNRIGEHAEIGGQVDAIEQASLRAADLTDQLLRFARGGKLKTGRCDLNEVVEKVASMIRPTFDRSIDIRIGLLATLTVLEGDAGQLEQALLNLCINARDAMPGGGTLRIETRNIPSPALDGPPFAAATAECIVLSVSDTGSGIPIEIQPRIFEPFFTTKEPGKGTGMGLAMVYGIVTNHGGRIEIASAAGAGTTFRILFPASAGTAEPLPAQAAPAPLPRGSETVLFVDDEEALRALAREMLGGLGYTILTAADGVEALKIFEERRKEIALVILDLVMPEMGGEETFGWIRTIDPSARVLVSSGDAAEGRIERLLAEGARGFVKKPYRLATLASAVRQALHGGP